ncbi:unnamed protein product [Nesidiocoris tenuis]|uniref:Uncharacterized protein n=1 Tax=Nesidiocoris tenuis TaxID=355587 RepID=A0A6H5HGT6_9HEMI|nr:unnamed protein product [Nesidiocoris tenuis]CAB0016626.1 unnamed protein product [Nesidiocoris tenuis]
MDRNGRETGDEEKTNILFRPSRLRTNPSPKLLCSDIIGFPKETRTRKTPRTILYFWLMLDDSKTSISSVNMEKFRSAAESKKLKVRQNVNKSAPKLNFDPQAPTVASTAFSSAAGPWCGIQPGGAAFSCGTQPVAPVRALSANQRCDRHGWTRPPTAQAALVQFNRRIFSRPIAPEPKKRSRRIFSSKSGPQVREISHQRLNRFWFCKPISA